MNYVKLMRLVYQIWKLSIKAIVQISTENYVHLLWKCQLEEFEGSFKFSF